MKNFKTEDFPIAEIFKNYFSNLSRGLCHRNVLTESVVACTQNTVSTAINKFRNLFYLLIYLSINSEIYLFNMYIFDLFFEVSNLEYASFADDTTPYSCLPEMIHILSKIEKGIQSMFDWLSESFLKSNADKCPLIPGSKVLIDA